MTWIHREAIGGARRLRLGVGGPSRSGKTYSALRIASGMQAVMGGEIFVIDTDNEFALDYADSFRFQHVDFPPPYTSERYQSAIQYCVDQGASIIVVDQMSHEQTGEGGVLERQEATETKLAEQWNVKREKARAASWAQAKGPHGKFVSFVTRVKQPIIFCFRAKDKLKIMPDGKWTHLGYTPICTEQFDYEMTAMLILPPNSDGKPDKELSEIREPLRPVIHPGEQIDEALGKRLAQWCSGSKPKADAPVVAPALASPSPSGDATTEGAAPVDPLLVLAREWADHGIDAYAKWWTGITAQQRKRIGAERHEEFKAIASKVPA